jgi:hypothetical protein
MFLSTLPKIIRSTSESDTNFLTKVLLPSADRSSMVLSGDHYMHDMATHSFLSSYAAPSAIVSPCWRTSRENAALHGDVSVLAGRRMR